MNKKKKLVIISLSILLVCVLGIGLYVKIKEEYYKNLFEEINIEFENYNYEEALRLSSKLPKPYSTYYVDYIRDHMSMKKWSGTAKELYDFLEERFNKYDFEQMQLPQKYYLSPVWYDEMSAEESFAEKKKQISSELEWYHEYYLIYSKYVGEYENILDKNVKLMENPENKKTVRIIWEIVDMYDDKVETLCVETQESLNELKNKYDISEENDDEIKEFEKYIWENLEFYKTDLSWRTVCSYDGNNNIILNAKVALEYYERALKLASLSELYPSSVAENLSYYISFWDEKIWEKYKNNSKPAKQLIVIFMSIYPDVLPEVEESYDYGVY